MRKENFFLPCRDTLPRKKDISILFRCYIVGVG
jgi:hypothetical protein